ncbi:MAG: hypothetical protein P8075_07535 [Deltaproteobacteria bacterium]|jgi:hypothetical protein
MIKRLHLACLVLLCLAMIYLASCSTAPSHRPTVQFTKAPSPSAKGQFPNWQLPPQELETVIYERALAGKIHAEKVKRTAHGTTGALSLLTEDEVTGKELRWKLKKMVPGWLDSFNTSFRKELAAYEVQKLFLDPEDYVVPTALPICVPRERYLKIIGYAAASLEGTDCVMCLASTWLVDVTIPHTLYDESRFLKDPTYAYYMSNFNILTYLIQHRDARVGQFLVAKDDKRRQVFSVDNGISFGFWPYNFLHRQWDTIHLPALRRDSIDRLRKLQRQDLDYLEVIAQLEKDENGILKPVPPGENMNPQNGATYIDGTLQYGLTRSDIDDLWERIQTLISEVDSGNIQVF